MKTKIDQWIRSYCQGKFWRTFLLLYIISLIEIIGLLIVIKILAPEVYLFWSYIAALVVSAILAAFAANSLKHLFK